MDHPFNDESDGEPNAKADSDCDPRFLGLVTSAPTEPPPQLKPLGAEPSSITQ